MKVLISDDDPTLRMLMRNLLQKRLGYEVFETSDGLKAWQALDAGVAPDLCILDVWMPEMGGLDLLVKLRSDSRFKDQKVILCSMENGSETILRAASLGISAYLLKPFMAQQFLNQVRKVFEGGKSESAQEALEPLESVVERLGIDNKTYLELLKVFTNDMTGLITQLRLLPPKTAQKETGTRLGGLRGAGRSLGAEALVAAIIRLEHIDPAAGPSAVRSCIDSLQNENGRVVAESAVIARRVELSENPPDAGNLKFAVTALSVDDVLDLSSFALRIREKADVVSLFLSASLGGIAQTILEQSLTSSWNSTEIRLVLVEALNSIIAGPSIYDEARFATVELRAETRQMLAIRPDRQDSSRLNRLLLEDAFPQELARSPDPARTSPEPGAAPSEHESPAVSLGA